MVNDGEVPHALEVEGDGIEVETGSIAPGEAAELTVELREGEYEVYCPIGDHRAEGMEGTLVVGSGAAGGTGTGTGEEEDEGEDEGSRYDRATVGRVKPRARDLGIEIGRLAPGPENAITDVAGVRVGHTTLIEGTDVRTGVTVVAASAGAALRRLPPDQRQRRADRSRVGTRLGPAHDAGRADEHALGRRRPRCAHRRLQPDGPDWSLPVVGETFDGFLNDINGFHVRPEHVAAALESARDGVVEEGSVGGGTGMICHGFKGGIGTSSRRLEDGATVGVLVQANHGQRLRLRVNGVPSASGSDRSRSLCRDRADEGAGSIIVLVATDAPLLPGQCERLARRAAFGIARTGGMGEISSGDFALCFATGNRASTADVPELDAPDAQRPADQRALRGRDRRGRGVDRERAPRGRDDDRPRRQHRPRARPRAAGRRVEAARPARPRRRARASIA